MYHQAVLLLSFPTWVPTPSGSQKPLVTAFLGQHTASKGREAAKSRAGLKASEVRAKSQIS